MSQSVGKVYDPNTNVRDSQNRLALGRLKSNFKGTNVSVGTSPTPIPAVAWADRVNITVQNQTSVTIYLGDSNVSPTNGFQLFPNADRSYAIDDTAIIYACVATGTQNLWCEESI